MAFTIPYKVSALERRPVIGQTTTAKMKRSVVQNRMGIREDPGGIVIRTASKGPAYAGQFPVTIDATALRVEGPNLGALIYPLTKDSDAGVLGYVVKNVLPFEYINPEDVCRGPDVAAQWAKERAGNITGGTYGGYETAGFGEVQC